MCATYRMTRLEAMIHVRMPVRSVVTMMSPPNVFGHSHTLMFPCFVRKNTAHWIEIRL